MEFVGCAKKKRQARIDIHAVCEIMLDLKSESGFCPKESHRLSFSTMKYKKNKLPLIFVVGGN